MADPDRNFLLESATAVERKIESILKLPLLILFWSNSTNEQRLQLLSHFTNLKNVFTVSLRTTARTKTYKVYSHSIYRCNRKHGTEYLYTKLLIWLYWHRTRQRAATTANKSPQRETLLIASVGITATAPRVRHPELCIKTVMKLRHPEHLRGVNALHQIQCIPDRQLLHAQRVIFVL